MKTAERIAAALVVLACILRLMHLQGASILMTVSLCGLAVIYLFYGYALFSGTKPSINTIDPMPADMPAGKKMTIYGVRVGLASLCVGVLFKMQHYPGAQYLLYAGLTLLVVCGFFVVMQFIRTKEKLERAMLLRIAIVGALWLLVLILFAVIDVS